MYTTLLPANVTYERHTGFWRLDLHSEDGTTWTIFKDKNKAVVLNQAITFSKFSGLPVTSCEGIVVALGECKS